MATVFSQLMEKLASPDPTTRRRAAEDLGDLRDNTAVTALLDALEDPQVAVREAAVDALVAIGGQELYEKATQLLESEDARLRNYAVEILERTGPDSIDALVKCCSSPDSDVRKFALDILGKVAKGYGDMCLDVIAVLLKDENINVASSAAETLGHIGDSRAVSHLEMHLGGSEWMQMAVFDALSEIRGADALKALNSVNVDSLSPYVKHFYESALSSTRLSVKGTSGRVPQW